jgi:hypothetical protein
LYQRIKPEYCANLFPLVAEDVFAIYPVEQNLHIWQNILIFYSLFRCWIKLSVYFCLFSIYPSVSDSKKSCLPQ